MTKPMPKLATGDALIAGQTLRSFAKAGRPNPEDAEIYRRVGEWLVAAEQAACAAQARPLAERAAEVVMHALAIAKGDVTDAASSLLTGLITILLRGTDPQRAIAIAISTMADALEQHEPTAIGAAL